MGTSPATHRMAKHFHFDSEASAKLGEFSSTCADLVFRNAEFAIPPYEYTYVEIDNHAALQAVGFPVDEDAATRIGFLFHREPSGRIVIHTLGGTQSESFVVPFLYHSRARTHREPDSMRETKKRLFAGHVPPEIIPEVQKALEPVLDEWTFEFSKGLTEDVFRDMVDETTGTFKRGLAALLLLNQSNRIQITGQPHQRKIVKGKSVVFAAHSVVKIDLSPKEFRKTFSNSDRASPRRHEVRGHFVHYHRVLGCEHRWQAQEVKPGEKEVARWRCASCNALRVFRESFHRGDAGIGFSTKQYDVTASVK